MKIRIKDVKPNPFRNIDEYPIDPEKVDQLRESIRETGFWDNIVARRTRSGDVEIAYGHHRLTALTKELGSSAEIDVIVRALTDEQMVKIMARENMEESRSVPLIDQQTVRAVLKGYAEGKWELHSRRPGGAQREVDGKPYTVEAVAEFTGLPKNRARYALIAIEQIDEGKLKPAHFKDLSHEAAQQMVREVKSVKEPARARSLAAEARREYVESKAKRETSAVRKAVRKAEPRAAKSVDWNVRARLYAVRLDELFERDNVMFKDLGEIVRHGAEVHVRWQEAIIHALDKHARRANVLLAALRGERRSPKLLSEGGR